MVRQVDIHLVWLQAANDGDFVIPTVKPLSRGSSRHSILTSSGHEATHSRGQWHPDQSSKRPSSRKTSFRLVVQDAVPLPEDMQSAADLEPSFGLQLQQQHQSKGSAFESQEQAPSEESSVTSQHHQEAVTQLREQVPSDGDAQELANKRAVDKQSLEQPHSRSLSGASLARQTQKRTKPMHPVQDWVGFGSRKQLHK